MSYPGEFKGDNTFRTVEELKSTIQRIIRNTKAIRYLDFLLKQVTSGSRRFISITFNTNTYRLQSTHIKKVKMQDDKQKQQDERKKEMGNQ